MRGKVHNKMLYTSKRSKGFVNLLSLGDLTDPYMGQRIQERTN